MTRYRRLSSLEGRSGGVMRSWRPSIAIREVKIRAGRMTESGRTHGPKRVDDGTCVIRGCNITPRKYAPLCWKHHRKYWIGKAKNK